MSNVIKSISVSRTIRSTEIWTLTLDPEDENNERYLKLIEGYRKDNITKEELYKEYHERYIRLIESYRARKLTKSDLFYEIAESGLAESDEVISNERFNIIIE